MTDLSTFVYASSSSAAMEIYLAYQAYVANGHLPRRFTKPAFYLIRLALAAVAGGLAIAYGPTRPLEAVYLGISAPAILNSMAKGTKVNDSRPDADVPNILDHPVPKPPELHMPSQQGPSQEAGHCHNDHNSHVGSARK